VRSRLGEIIGRVVAVGVVAVGVVVVGSACGAGEVGVDALAVTDGRTRPTSFGNDAAAVYFTVLSPIDDEIVSIDVDPGVAAHASMHETLVDGAGHDHHSHGGGGGGGDAVITMERATSFVVIADEVLAFEPGGRHVMLEGLVEPLAAGERIEIVVRFAHGGDVVVPVVVAVDV
jgi:copper(I)-binding protein